MIALCLPLGLLMSSAALHHLFVRNVTFVACLLYVLLLAQEIWWLVEIKESFFLITFNIGFYGYLIFYLFHRREEDMTRVMWRNLLGKGIVASLLTSVPAQSYLRWFGLGGLLLLLLVSIDDLIERRESVHKNRLTILGH